MAKKLIVNAGAVYGKLTVIKEAQSVRLPSGQLNRRFICKCKCGKETTVRLVHLANSRTTSCGCNNGERHSKSKSALYRVWQAMIQRCEADYSNSSERYKTRGIKVCDSWRLSYSSFEVWAIHNGYKKGCEIDRINNNGNYYPENCRVVPRFVNVSNREISFKVEYHGIIISLSLLLRFLSIDSSKFSLIHRRLQRGWSFDIAIARESHRNKYVNKRGYRKVEMQDGEAREKNLKLSKFNEHETN